MLTKFVYKIVRLTSAVIRYFINTIHYTCQSSQSLFPKILARPTAYHSLRSWVQVAHDECRLTRERQVLVLHIKGGMLALVAGVLLCWCEGCLSLCHNQNNVSCCTELQAYSMHALNRLQVSRLRFVILPSSDHEVIS